MLPEYQPEAPERADVDALAGPTLLEFGTAWCGHCQRAQALVETAVAALPGLRHLRLEDGPGRRLGRTFGVKLWPTLVCLVDGIEVARVVRPQTLAELHTALAALDTAQDK